MKFRNWKGWKAYFLVYVILLLVSHLVLWAFDSPIRGDEASHQKVLVNVVQEDHSLANKKISLEYESIYNGEESNPPVLILLPGGPEGPEVFEGLRSALAKEYRLIIPHLPGYGDPHNGLPDYSFKALAVYTNQLLDQLKITNAHVLGFGLGGASAVYLANDFPSSVQSLILASSIGVQELELLGSYRLNHAVHAVQLGAVWLFYNVIPHFGLFEAIDINVSYAKSHYESDQRPIRSHLNNYLKPMLIVHGIEDPLVPVAAAKEHHRIVPQSTLHLYQADHDLLETHSDSVSKAIADFLLKVEAGASEVSRAPQQRIAAAQKPFSNVEFAKFKGASLLLIMIIIILATFISEDLTCIGAGLLAARGLIGFWPATVACLIGIFVGDIGLYLAGRVFGRSAIRKAPLKWFVSPKDLEKSARWFDARGPAIIIASRFLPGSRMPTYFSAGVIGAGFWMFASYFLLAAIIWTPLLVGISKILGNELLRYFAVYRDYALWVFVGAIIFLIMVVKVIIPIFSYKGRRLLVSRYRRLTRWEYWSPIVTYMPVFCYVLYMGIKFRSLTLFTAANPAIPDGGFIGESKSDILSLFKDQQYVAQYHLITADLDDKQKIEEAHQFMEKQDYSFPIVLKPDVGQRGQGVSIIHNAAQMEAYLWDSEKDIIIQEYVDGSEYGVFYYKIPGDSSGQIFTVTTKTLLSVTGDGKRTLEELILDDNNAVNLAKHHLQQHQDRLYEVPKEGEEIPIVEIGTHAKGATFGDGNHLITKHNTTKLNTICDSVEGFYFGRFDLKAPSEQHFKKGRELKIVEVNGVTSESTNIYDSNYSFIDAQRTLWRQWELAFKIGQKATKREAQTTSSLQLLKHIGQSLLTLRRR